MTYGDATADDGRLSKLVVLWALSSTYLGSYLTICLEQVALPLPVGGDPPPLQVLMPPSLPHPFHLPRAARKGREGARRRQGQGGGRPQEH